MKKRITFDLDLELYNRIIEIKNEEPYKISISSFLNTIIGLKIQEIEKFKNAKRH